jgi:two-component system clock-associated histidine kinase SasA
MKLLLFIDERPSSQEYVRQIQNYLHPLTAEVAFALQIIDIRQQPHLVEHFRLVTTPALVKVTPEPRQTLAGSNLVEQFEKWFPRWQRAMQASQAETAAPATPSRQSVAGIDSVSHSAELMSLSDEIFRLKQEREELLGQLKFKEQVLAMLAHDLRNPLTAASIAVETLELTQEQEDSERIVQLQQQLYQQARKQFRLMNRMIADILQASKAMSAQLQVQYSQVFLQDFCPDILHQFASLFQKKQQVLESDIPLDLPSVYVDEELIRQVIVNLLENAAKYTPEGGKISFHIIHRTSQKVQVSVCDTGPGIPKEKQQQVFEGHFRLQRDEAKEGYGLGLALCRKIIGAHYGQIWVDSVPEQGSSFNFTLPVYRS